MQSDLCQHSLLWDEFSSLCFSDPIALTAKGNDNDHCQINIPGLACCIATAWVSKASLLLISWVCVPLMPLLSLLHVTVVFTVNGGILLWFLMWFQRMGKLANQLCVRGTLTDRGAALVLTADTSNRLLQYQNFFSVSTGMSTTSKSALYSPETKGKGE